MTDTNNQYANAKTPGLFGLFYGSSTCYTEMSGEKIQAVLGADKVDMFNIADTPLVQAEFYQYLIFGIPTWDYGELQEDWEEVWPDLDTLSLEGKHVAIYGQGDQLGYPEWFQDAVGYLHEKLQARGAHMCGYWPVTGYTFEQSKALSDDGQHFLGLALDDENEYPLSEERIDRWCQQILHEFGLS